MNTRLSHHQFEETHVFELPTVCKECPDEAAETVKDLRREVLELQKDVSTWKFRFEYAEQLLKAAHEKILPQAIDTTEIAQPKAAADKGL